MAKFQHGARSKETAEMWRMIKALRVNRYAACSTQ
jgi:hypothetical protein